MLLTNIVLIPVKSSTYTVPMWYLYYMVHYFIVRFGYAIDSIGVPISVRIPVTATITFFLCWGFVAVGHRVMPKYAKWIFG